MSKLGYVTKRYFWNIWSLSEPISVLFEDYDRSYIAVEGPGDSVLAFLNQSGNFSRDMGPNFQPKEWSVLYVRRWKQYVKNEILVMFKGYL